MMKFAQVIFFTIFLIFSNLGLADTTPECICQKYLSKYDIPKEHVKPDTCTTKLESSGATLSFHRQVDSENFTAYSISVNSNRVACTYEQKSTPGLFSFFKNGIKNINHISNFPLPNELTAKDAINNCAIYLNKNISDSNPCLEIK